ncbi:MAG TPA: head GIN domain-containing protein [Pyrinomonadaceae bacterium]|nr:head GIN domain-containing protein [Pyrinomonadaceae bacterium]
MKKLLLLFALLALLTGCHGIHNGVAGSGRRLKEKREVKSFTSISTEGAFDIEVVCQQGLSLEIEGDENVLPLVSTEVSNNVLHVKNTQGYSVSAPVTLKISVPDLEAISSSGAGNIDISKLKARKFLIDASGAPTIHASGETEQLNIDASGAGKIDANRLRSTKAIVESKGVSTVEVYASETLDITVNGPSHVIYRGNAVVNKTINGPGSIEKRESEVS